REAGAAPGPGPVAEGKGGLWPLSTSLTTLPPPTRVNPPPEHCALPRVLGPCWPAFSHWFYSPGNGTCQEFIYGGCRGSKKNFQTPEECLSRVERERSRACGNRQCNVCDSILGLQRREETLLLPMLLPASAQRGSLQAASLWSVARAEATGLWAFMAHP
uniref:BPTI/Kunitz inhibitor domain-containing protein n=1 Tax=Calidris pygmaea TaxID=425635 RepID=A0A8C3KIE8_9CHAR